MRELGLLFGSTAHATAGTLAVFFAGLAIGGGIWSYRAPRAAQPLAEYGLLEIGVAASGLLFFVLMMIYAAVYSSLYSSLGEYPSLLLAAKLVLAAGVLLPPAILMGGTLPLISQHLVHGNQSLGRVGTLLYGVNTLGAAAGALAAGWWLPVWLGFRGAYLLAVLISLVIGITAWLSGRQNSAMHDVPRGAVVQKQPNNFAMSPDADAVPLAAPRLIIVAFASGALALALEVVWTRMFQQVLQNSVYTFAIILVTFLTALAAGAFIARRLSQARMESWLILALVLAAAAVGTIATPFAFYSITDGMRYLGAGEAWSVYRLKVLGGALAVLFLPGAAVGSVFPFLLHLARDSGAAGLVIGRLTALNTSGAIAGSLLAGFVLLKAFGMWTTLLLISLLYLTLAVWIVMPVSRRTAAVLASGLLIALTVANPSTLPGVRLKSSAEKLLASWEGSDGFVSVIERNGSRRIKVNNFYALGSSAAAAHEQNQTLIPLMPHPSPQRLFYLGMGTGITAGAALRLPSLEVTVTELVPEVITAAAAFFNDFTFGLFTDPRARVLARDGRNELRGNRQRYDAIISDLFIPWRAGVGNLYSRDHYSVARERLESGGIYVQWIPTYQVTADEFWIIARTFLDVFPQVRVWRGDFYVDSPIIALVGSVDASPLRSSDLIRNGRHLSGGSVADPTAFLAVTLPFYAGNLGASREIVPAGPLHTDDNPVIDYQAPISHRNSKAGVSHWFAGSEYLQFLDELQAATPPEADPFLSELTPSARDFVAAGLIYYRSALEKHSGSQALAERYFLDFLERMPVRISFDTTGQGVSDVEE